MTTEHDPIVIVGMSRTPMGAFQGDLAAISAPELGAVAIKAALERAEVKAETVEDVIMGCVLPAGLGQAPARQAAIKAGLLDHTPCTTINKMCGSGLKAVMMAHDHLAAGSSKIVVAGGMESMSNAPYLLEKARGGYRMGHGKVLDHMFTDGLEDAYEKKLMGVYADETAAKLGITRQEQDDFALKSLARAVSAIESGAFDAEIAPVTMKSKAGDVVVSKDESPLKAKPEKIPSLKPAFSLEGTVTAANASSISDGAAAVVMMKKSEAAARGLKPLMVIHGHASHAQKPGEFTLAPIGAVRSVLDKVKWHAEMVDLFEINEAFAVVTLAAMRALNLDHAKVNVNGGACALGHPVGASGARILVTLYHALLARQLKKGVAALCIGGGEAVAVAVEVL
jgi:acetyl-CoA C-acetyltransferase